MTSSTMANLSPSTGPLTWITDPTAHPPLSSRMDRMEPPSIMAEGVSM